MNAATWVLVDDVETARDARGQMDADTAMLDAVRAGGPPMLRVYRWATPTLSLGRFQPEADVEGSACRHWGVDVVRRPTGGRAVLHGADVTYAVAMRIPDGPTGRVDALYRHVAGGVIAALARLGVTAEVACHRGPTDPVCFASQRGADLRVGDRKVCGSAQVRRDGAVLQHGSVLVDRLAFDETDLVAGLTPPARAAAKGRLRAATVTLGELGVEADPRAVAAALVSGFAATLDVKFQVMEPAAGG